MSTKNTLKEILESKINFEEFKNKKKALEDSLPEAEAIEAMLKGKTIKEQLALGFNIDQAWEAVRIPEDLSLEISLLTELLQSGVSTWAELLKHDPGLFYQTIHYIGLRWSIDECYNAAENGYEKVYTSSESDESGQQIKSESYESTKKLAENINQYLDQNYVVIVRKTLIRDKFIFNDQQQSISQKGSDGIARVYYRDDFLDAKIFPAEAALKIEDEVVNVY